MILTKYLSREVLKSQLAILFILLIIFFSQQLINVLSSASTGKIPANLVFSVLGLAMPALIQLILPLSLFIAILITLGRLYAESEITTMFACGAGQNLLVKLALLLSLPTMLFAMGNSFYFSPYALKKQALVLSDAKTNPSASIISSGQFINLNNTVIFVDTAKSNILQNVYIFQLNPIKNIPPFISTAQEGYLKVLNNGDQILHLENTQRVEGKAGAKDFNVENFEQYEVYVGHKKPTFEVKNEEMLNLNQLLKRHTSKTITELHWRLTLIFSIPIMALIAIVLCRVNPRQGRFAKMLPALLLYLVYFLLQSSLKSAGESGKLSANILIPLVNLGFLGLAIYLNLTQTPILYNFRWGKLLKSKKNLQEFGGQK